MSSTSVAYRWSSSEITWQNLNPLLMPEGKLHLGFDKPHGWPLGPERQ
jgi:hypothetical protein